MLKAEHMNAIDEAAMRMYQPPERVFREAFGDFLKRDDAPKVHRNTAATPLVTLAVISPPGEKALPAPAGDKVDADKVTPKPPRKPRATGKPSKFMVTDGGVFLIEPPVIEGGADHHVFVCAKLEIVAMIRDHQSGQWGRLLRWQDPDKHIHEWAMPMAALQGDGQDVRRELAEGGLSMALTPKGKNALIQYLAETAMPERARGVDRTGWHPGKGGAMVFAFPGQTIGDAGEIVRYQCDTLNRTYTQAGSLEGWGANVAALCVNNSRCTLAVSASFAALLLNFSGLESGGINLRGNSSTGKTTALIAAASVFGGAGYVQRWRATGNGLEATAAQHNDTLLILDELAQVDPKEAGEIAYMLANGQGKQRAQRTGKAKPRESWQLLFLSAGEISLTQHMLDGGKKAKAGQEVRMVDLAADPGAGHGLFEVLHGQPDGAALSTAIKAGAAQHHGHAALDFVKRITDGMNTEVLRQYLKTEINQFVRDQFPAEQPNGQAWRVCERFALIGIAGEVATSNGVTGWPPGMARAAAATCFNDWLKERGNHGNSEAPAMIEAVRSFIAKHEESRFTDLDAPPSGLHGSSLTRITINRAGWRRNNGSGREYLIDPATFKAEICQGFDHVAVAKELAKAGHLIPATESGKVRYATRSRIEGEGNRRVYVVDGSILED